MAKYTIELSSLFMATVTANSQQENDALFSPTPLQALNDDVAVLRFFKENVGDFPATISDDQLINQKFLVTFERNFLRHFYTLEISQENPLSWFILLSDFLNSEMPRFIKQYQALAENDWLLTGVSDGSSSLNATQSNVSDTDATQNNKSTSNQLNANADTPQNALDFSLDSEDPTKDYNFNYASVVAGAKSGNNADTISNQKITNNGNTDQKTANQATQRNQTIMGLITELDTFANGVYLNLWTRATRQYHLFMGVY